MTKLSELTNAAATNKEYGAYHYKLTADIDMTGAAFSGLNCVETAWNYETFTGTFDGEHPPMPPMEGIPPEFGNHIFEEEKQKKQQDRKRIRRIEEIEQLISAHETTIEKNEALLCEPDVFQDHERALDLTEENQRLNQTIEALMEEWELLHQEETSL